MVNIINNSKTIYLPTKSTIFQLMKYCIEIRAIPKKVDLFSFSEFCSDEDEKRSLILLSSKEGSKLYDEFVLGKHFGFIDLLRNFRSCKPDLRTFLNHSINLVPRYYSMIEFDKDQESIDKKVIFNYKLKIAFNVTQLPSIYKRKDTQLFGIFTGQINRLYEMKSDLVNEMNLLSIEDRQQLYVFKRKNLMFRLSDKLMDGPIFMLSIGTGLTPFLSLIKYKQKLIAQSNNSEIDKLSDLYLIHGCRTKNDCLYFDELNKFHEKGILRHLKICYSREDNDGYRHVNDYLKTMQMLKDLIIENQNFSLFICGDQIKFPKDVLKTLAELIDRSDADLIVKKMLKEKKILQDVWL